MSLRRLVSILGSLSHLSWIASPWEKLAPMLASVESALQRDLHDGELRAANTHVCDLRSGSTLR